jgi:Sulfatase-modifying factor enzyme 1
MKSDFLPPMVAIPGGIFVMGSDDHYREEAPAHRVHVDGFLMDVTPVVELCIRSELAPPVRSRRPHQRVGRSPGRARHVGGCGSLRTLGRQALANGGRVEEGRPRRTRRRHLRVGQGMDAWRTPSGKYMARPALSTGSPSSATVGHIDESRRISLRPPAEMSGCAQRDPME